MQAQTRLLPPASVRLTLAAIAALGGLRSAQDLDGDGWSPADGDCCDVPTAACPFPELVNPGAIEIVGNGIDDDCDGAVDEASAGCSLAEDYSVDGWDLAAAMELCDVAAAAPALIDKRWGVVDARLVYADGSDPGAYAFGLQTAALSSFGSAVGPQEGATMAVLSTGTARDASDPGFTVPTPGTDHFHVGSPPASFVAAHGGALPGASWSGCGSCPPGSGANDSVNLRLTLRVPTNADGFRLRHRFFAADFHVYWCTVYDDFALGLLQTGAGAPFDGNILLDQFGQHLSLDQALFDTCEPNVCLTCPSGTTALGGTGYDTLETDGKMVGAATPWLQASAAVVPGEELVLELMVFDASDRLGDSLLLLDAFEWDLIDPCPTGPASEVVRLGVPPNPNALLPGQTSGPVVGAVWDPLIDHAAFVPSSALDGVAIATGSLNFPMAWGTLLCDPSSPNVRVYTTPGTPFHVPVPASCVFIGVQLYSQGYSITASGEIHLTNALDLTLGSF